MCQPMEEPDFNCQTITMEAEEDAPMYRKNLRRATKWGHNLRPLLNILRILKWEIMFWPLCLQIPKSSVGKR